MAAMISAARVRALALELPGAEERPHFERPSFRVKGRIFAVLHEAEGRVVLKLSAADQSIAIASHPEAFEPAGAWGRQGWTYVTLGAVPPSAFKLLLDAAWNSVAAPAPRRRKP